LIDHTFQLIPSVGPSRERELWKRGIHSWAEFPPDALTLSSRQDAPLREAIVRAREALETGQANALARMLPRRVRWRLFPHFAEEAAYLDIETEGPEREITAIGMLWRGQVFSFVSGFNLEKFEQVAEQIQVLVTFNGSAFDVPILEHYFRHLRLPVAHIDARFAGRTAGMEGGLKKQEIELGIARPPHLMGIHGLEATRLWRAWKEEGSVSALRLFVEYNLFDAIQLRPLMERIFNRCAERALSGAPTLPETERGDVLYDVSRKVLEFG
jgi:uncharacterized protein YprB with RNaseH-like and TPR domain